MTEILREVLAPLIAVAVYFLLRKVERHGYRRGYEDALYDDRRPKFSSRSKVGFKITDSDE